MQAGKDINNTLVIDNLDSNNTQPRSSSKSKINKYYIAIIKKLQSCADVLRQERQRLMESIQSNEVFKAKSTLYEKLNYFLDYLLISNSNNAQYSEEAKSEPPKLPIKDHTLDLNAKFQFATEIVSLQHADEPSVHKLMLSNNKIKSIETLSKMNMPNLLQIYLHNNEIKDIDPLVRVQFPLLEVLWLNNNKIYSLEPLTKVNFPVLQRLGLYSNRILTIQPLTHVSFPKLDELNLANNKFDVKEIDKYKSAILKCLKSGWSILGTDIRF